MAEATTDVEVGAARNEAATWSEVAVKVVVRAAVKVVNDPPRNRHGAAPCPARSQTIPSCRA